MGNTLVPAQITNDTLGSIMPIEPVSFEINGAKRIADVTHFIEGNSLRPPYRRRRGHGGSGSGKLVIDTDGVGLGDQEISTLIRRVGTGHVGEISLAGVEGMDSDDNNESVRIQIAGVDNDGSLLWGYQHLWNSTRTTHANQTLSTIVGVEDENKMSVAAYDLTMEDNTTDMGLISAASEIQYWLDMDDASHISGNLGTGNLDMTELMDFFKDPVTGLYHDISPDVIDGSARGHDEVYWRAYNTFADSVYVSDQDYITTGTCGASIFLIENDVNDWSANAFYVDTTLASGPVSIEGHTTLLSGVADLDVTSGATLGIASTGAMKIDSAAALELEADGLMTVDANAAFDMDVVGAINIDGTATIEIFAGTNAQFGAQTGSMVVSGKTTSIDGTEGVSIASGSGYNVTIDLTDATDKLIVATGIVDISAANGELRINGTKVVDAQLAHVADADGSLASVTSVANTILSRLETHGLLASS